MIEVIKKDFGIDDIGFNEQFPIFTKSNTIWIPKKVETVLRRHIPKRVLLTIDKDIDVAIEKCLIVLSNLSSTYYTEEKWKSLSSNILHEQTYKYATKYLYSKIINILLTGSEKKGSIIEVHTNYKGVESYSKGNYSKMYRLSRAYSKIGLTKYEIKTSEMKNRREQIYWKMIKECMSNEIGRALIDSYTTLNLPSEEEILIEGKRLSKEGYITSKGKKLTIRGTNSDSNWSDVSNRVFVEDHIKIFNYLTSEGLMIPIIGGENSGGRVYDSINLLPSWIRRMIKLKDKKTVETDISCLHPNLAITIYGGESEFLTHQQIADELGIDIKVAKIEHLSFFNLPFEKMYNSKIFKFYEQKELNMLSNIYNDKEANGYKSTSKELFSLEVKIMTETIKRLSAKGINILYVFDSLISTEEDKPEVEKTMNEVLKEFMVKTTAK